jgi:tetratricopeptide (TPR) repeat protein
MKFSSKKDNFEQTLLEAEDFFKTKKWDEALVKYKSLLITRPRSRHLLFQIALVCNQLGDYTGAYNYLKFLNSINANDADVLTNLAVVCTKLSLVDEAIKFFQLALLNKPDDLVCLINLAGIYNINDDYHASLKFIKKALLIDPLNANLYAMLGVTLIKLDQLITAKTILETALTFDPTLSEAKFNVAIIEYKYYNHIKSIEILEDMLINSNLNEINSISKDSIKFCLALNYLSIGRLSDGWRYYDSGLHPSISPEFRRNPTRNFPVPMWDGHKNSDKKILFWGEQGVGDQIMFASCLPDLMEDGLKIIIECDKRLVPIFKRSFPEILDCRETSYDETPNKNPIYKDFDLHFPFGSMMSLCRKELHMFDKSTNYLRFDVDLKKQIEIKINARHIEQKKKIKIGISWRSGKLNPERSRHYTKLVDWKPIFEISNAEFFNLQYGECEDEILEVEKLYGIKIIRFEEVDLKNDLDLTLALISNLDLVITINTAVRSLAASIGKQVFLMGLIDYENFGTNYYPFHPKIKFLSPSKDEQLSECLPKMAKFVNEYIENNF